MAIYFQAFCKCGWRSEPVQGKIKAEVLADRHETSARVAHKHDTVVAEEVR